MDSRQSKAIEKIEKAGLTEQYNQLVAQGYTNPWLNYKLLKHHEGNLDQVVIAINEHKKRKQAKDAKALEIIEKMGWSNQHKELVEKGFTVAKKNLKALLRTEGDLAKSIEKLGLKKELKSDKPIEEILEQHGFKVQFEKLKEMGYTDEKRNLRMLMKFNGNLESILERLLNDKGHGHHCHNHGKQKKDKGSQEFLEFKQKKKEFKKKLHQLQDQGIHGPKGVKLLAIWNGDVDAVIKWFKAAKPKVETQGETQQEQTQAKEEQTLTQE